MLNVVIANPRPSQLYAAKRTAIIRRLNDELRKNLPRTDSSNRFVVTAKVARLTSGQFANLLSALRTFSDFRSSNDFHGEHDFGAIDFEQRQYFWKIKQYDRSMEYGSPDPTDSLVTIRMLTLMRADEF